LSSRLIHLFFVLREWRGGLHLNATTAMGLGLVEAIQWGWGAGAGLRLDRAVPELLRAEHEAWRGRGDQL